MDNSAQDSDLIPLRMSDIRPAQVCTPPTCGPVCCVVSDLPQQPRHRHVGSSWSLPGVWVGISYQAPEEWRRQLEESLVGGGMRFLALHSQGSFSDIELTGINIYERSSFICKVFLSFWFIHLCIWHLFTELLLGSSNESSLHLFRILKNKSSLHTLRYPLPGFIF